MQVFLFIELCHICLNFEDLTFSNNIYSKMLLKSFSCHIITQVQDRPFGFILKLPKPVKVFCQTDFQMIWSVKSMAYTLGSNLITLYFTNTSCSYSVRHHAIPIVAFLIDAKNCHKKKFYKK